MTKTKEYLPRRIEGVKGDECNCGRRSTVLHCIHCGSCRVYARMNRIHKMMNGEMKHVESQYRCQTCGHLFIEEEREWCDAPAFTAILARQKARAMLEASRGNEFLAPEVVAKAQELAGQTVSPEIKAFVEAKDSEATASVVEGDIPQELADEVAKEFNKIENPTSSLGAAERAFLSEWSSAKWAGRVVPSFQEFKQRRMKGETVDVIVK